MYLLPKVIYKGDPKIDSWCRWAVNRVKNKNQSVNVRFVGDTGSGKSWSALYFCWKCAKLLEKEFPAERIYFGIKDVITEVAENEPPPKTIFMIDEQQVGASAKEHQSRKNQAYTKFLSTVRSNRYIIVTTLPFSDMEDKQLRRLFHVEVETSGANSSNNTVNAKPRYLEHSRQKDKTYRKRLLIVFKDKISGKTKTRKISMWAIAKPPQGLIDTYEPMKADFKRKLYKKLAKEIADFDSAHEETPENKPKMPKEKLVLFQQDLLTLIEGGIKERKFMIARLIERGHKCDSSRLGKAIDMLEKRGFIGLGYY
jgi:hypothetical protein